MIGGGSKTAELREATVTFPDGEVETVEFHGLGDGSGVRSYYKLEKVDGVVSKDYVAEYPHANVRSFKHRHIETVTIE